MPEPELTSQSRCITLIGMPGGGKSTVGRQVARRLGLPFHDSDHVIEQRIGCSITSFFQSEGEQRFRDVESEVLLELLERPCAVLATGGGIVLREANRRALRARSVCLYLRSTPEELFRRVRHDNRRPLLQVSDPLGRLREMNALRDPLYRETAHYVIETGRPSVPSLVNMVLMQLELAGHVPLPSSGRTVSDQGPA